MKTYYRFTFPLLLVLLLGIVSVSGAPPETFPQTSIGVFSLQEEQTLRQEVEKAVIAYFGYQPETEIVVDNLEREGNWAIGTVAVMATTEEHSSPWGVFFLAQVNASSNWQVVLEPMDDFTDWVTLVPDTLLSLDAQSLLTVQESMAEPNWYLPYASGETWTLSGGPHSNPRPWDNIDLTGGSGQVRAAQSGVISRPCNNFVRVTHADGWATTYYHLTNIAVSNGQTVTAGQLLGTTSAATGCGGSASGPHVHFGLELNGVDQNIHGHYFGGWLVQEGSAPYQGCLVKGSLTRCAPTGQIPNNGSSTPPPSPGTYVCDDGSSCFSFNGFWNPPTNTQYCRYDNDMLFGYACFQSSDCQANTDNYSVFWWKNEVLGNLPNFVPGNYEIFAYISRASSATPVTQNAHYYLRRPGQPISTSPIAIINQAQYQTNNSCADIDRWASLGTHYLYADSYLELRAWTGEGWGNPHHVIFADAVRLVWRQDTAAPTGSITSPINNSTTGSGVVNFTANASDNSGGSGVKHVKFWVFYSNQWHLAGTDTTSPYGINWTVPASLPSQQLKFGIHVEDMVGNIAIDPGGIRIVNYVQSNGVVENWIPQGRRAYLNQRSLPGGDAKCSAASMAMALAMTQLIGNDYNTMAAKANEMYPRVLQNGVAYIWKMTAELRRQGAVAAHHELNSNAAWQLIKTEIDAGRPVIVRTAHGVVTQPGHLFVAVGYREYGASRQVIIYDPFGRWLGSVGQYDRNTLDPSSAKGRWVFYDFPTIYGANNFLITVRNPNQATNDLILGGTPSTPPDVTSDEDEDIGVYAGVEIGGLAETFLPFILNRP